jgi:hypothetical protein
MKWKYGLIKISDEDGEDVCELVELYSDDGENYTSFCKSRISSIKELDAASSTIKKDGINYYFWENGVFSQKDGTLLWEKTEKV